jgi:hypothetical protein
MARKMTSGKLVIATDGERKPYRTELCAIQN